MARPNPKNFGLSPAATDLGVGLGAQLHEQAQTEEDQRRKKLIQDAAKQGMSPASMMLGLGHS